MFRYRMALLIVCAGLSMLHADGERAEERLAEVTDSEQKESEEDLGLGLDYNLPKVAPKDKKSPEQIEIELEDAERDFTIAQKMFIPWYTGPLITGSSHNVPKGHYNIQGYFFLNFNYGVYNNQRNFVETPTVFVMNPLLILQAGLTTWLDITIQPQGLFRWQEGSSGNYLSGESLGDLPIQFGLQILKETPYLPSIRVVISESLPTGSYTNLSNRRNGLDAGGAGVFKTIFGLNLGKILWKMPLHPMSLRFTTNYSIANNEASVTGVNAYGGADNTYGRVKVGSTFNADFGWEVSLTQRWVFAADVAYTYSWKSTFAGNRGTISPGVPAVMGSPSSDQLSFAPAIEYNINNTGGFIGGVWFSLTGRNSASFASAILSYTQFF